MALQSLVKLGPPVSKALGRASTSIFAPQTTPARSIFDLSLLVLSITGGIFVIVGGLLLYALIRYRQRDSDPNPDEEPPQIYGSNQIELSWTVIPVLIVVMLFLATTRVVYSVEHAHKPANALNVTVIAHQFWWEYRYPKFGVITANELHIPVSTHEHPLDTYLNMISADTDHSFWVPRLGGKKEVIPDQINTIWMNPDETGLYLGQCSGFCGEAHAKMLIRVYVDTPAQFAAWIAQQRQPAVEDPAVAQGKKVFDENACMNCHTIAGTVATGRFGPDLTHLASRDTIASGSVPLTQANLRAWIDDPQVFKPGALMPAMHLNAADLDAVTAYLMTLK